MYPRRDSSIILRTAHQYSCIDSTAALPLALGSKALISTSGSAAGCTHQVLIQGCPILSDQLDLHAFTTVLELSMFMYYLRAVPRFNFTL